MPINLLYSLLLFLLPVAGCLLTEASAFWIVSQLSMLAIALLLLKRFPNKRKRVAFFVLFTLLTYLLNSSYFFSYFLQNQGYNDAFFYHLKPNILFAGVGEYLSLIIFEVFHLLVLTACAVKIALRKPTPLPFQVRLNYLVPISLVVIYSFQPIYSLKSYGLGQLMGNSAFQAQAQSIIDDLSNSRVTLKTGNNKPNIVFIYLESVEQAYFDDDYFPGLMPKLAKIKANSINFTGLEQADKTSWTIAGMVASQCGYPLVPAYKGVSSNNSAITEKFMENARCHSDLLKENNYWLTYMSGEDQRFAGSAKFYKTHGYDEILGRNQLESTLEDRSYTHGWGLFDDSLFELSYKKFEELSAKNTPFNLTMATIDTHHPTGNPSKSCSPYPLENNIMLDAIYCTDQLAYDYITKIRQSQYSDNTVIVVMNDHLAMRNDLWDRLTAYKGKRNMTYFVNFPDGRKQTIASKGTHFDVLPTLYELLGFEIDGQFGFGRSLLNQDGFIHHKAGDIEVVKNDLLQDYVASLWAQQKISLEKSNITISYEGRDVSFAGIDYNLRSDGWGEPAASFFKFDKSMALQEVLAKGWSQDIRHDSFIKRLLASPNDNFLVLSKQKYLHGLVEGYQEDEHVYFFGSASGVENLSGRLTNDELTLSWPKIRRILRGNQSNEIVQKRYYSLQKLEDIIEKERFKIFFKNDHSLLLRSASGPFADSQLVDQSGTAFKLKRGLNVYSLDSNLTATFLDVYDGCSNIQSFKNKASLTQLVEKSKQKNGHWLALIGHDSIHCKMNNTALITPINDWGSGLFDLSGLSNIALRKPYLALLDVVSGTMIEIDNSESHSLTLRKNSEGIKLQK